MFDIRIYIYILYTTNLNYYDFDYFRCHVFFGNIILKKKKVPADALDVGSSESLD